MLRPSAKNAARKAPQTAPVNASDEGSTTPGHAPATYAPPRQVYRGLRQDELEAYFEEQHNEGVCFRRCLFFLIVFTLLFLLWLKWDRESIVAEIDEEKATVGEEEKQYFETLNIKKDEKNFREKVEEAYKRKVEELEKGGEGCEDCAKQLVAVKDAYNALSTHVVNDYHKVLDINKRAGYHAIKKAYLKAKKEAEEGKSSYDLVEIKEAYDIMSHPDARVYYNLYGAKPPALMKHQQKTTHGGWGVEVGMGTFKYAIILAWLEYFNNGWVEVAFFASIFIMMAVKVWNNREEFMQKLEQMEAMERMAMEGR